MPSYGGARLCKDYHSKGMARIGDDMPSNACWKRSDKQRNGTVRIRKATEWRRKAMRGIATEKRGEEKQR